MVDWVQIHNKNLAAIADKGLSHRLLSGKNCRLNLSLLLVLLPVESILMKEFLMLHFNQGAETCPVHLKLQSYNLICIFTNQSELLHNNQSEYMKLTN